MKKKILSVFLAVAILVSMFTFSFSASAAENGTWYREWLDAKRTCSKTYWYTWTTSDRQNQKQSYCPGTRFSGSPCGGYIYDVYRPSNGSFRKFLARVDFGRDDTLDSDWLNQILLEPGTKVTITIRGYLEGDFNWDKTWFQIYGIFSYREGSNPWSEPYTKSIMTDLNGNLVNYGKTLTVISDTKASFYHSVTFTNPADSEQALAIRGFDIYFDHNDLMSSYKVAIYDVMYKHTSMSASVEQDFSSVDNSTDSRVSIDGFFSFLNKPLNIIADLYRSVGNFIWSKTPSFLKDGIEDARTFFKTFNELLTSMFQNYFVSPLVEGFKNLTSNLKTFVSDPLGSIKTLIENIKNTLSNIASSIWNLLPQWLRDALTAVGNFVGNFFNQITTTLGNIFTPLFDGIKSLLSNIGDSFKRGFSAMLNIAKVIWTGCTFITSSLYFWVVSLGYLPGVIGGCMLAVIALAVVKLLFSL